MICQKTEIQKEVKRNVRIYILRDQGHGVVLRDLGEGYKPPTTYTCLWNQNDVFLIGQGAGQKFLYLRQCPGSGDM